ncbi:hypothetical protein C0580_01165 [Candidatus Parcubacteria bacterium]|nr:MAG: hypothetical protein C0580_01165 [Candidatus Parcubacteria bacterium]
MSKTSRQFNLSYSIKFDHKKTDQIKFWLAKPVIDKYQRKIVLKSSNYPIKRYSDNYDNKILYFHLKNENKFLFDLGIELSKDKGRVLQNWSLPNDSKLKKYTKSELFLEQTTEVKKLTKQIVQDKKTLHDKVRVIFDFVIDNFHYQYPVKNRGVKNLNLKNLRGDCGEYSALMVTMLRILGVPAKNQTGFVVYPKQKKVLEHAWLSAYFKAVGWVDFDPQYAAIEKNKTKYFGKRSDYRVVFTSGYNVPLRPVGGSSQILQPIACKVNTKFSDKFTIK